jgi:tetratricopeptide (TPR) repeat protein
MRKGLLVGGLLLAVLVSLGVVRPPHDASNEQVEPAATGAPPAPQDPSAPSAPAALGGRLEAQRLLRVRDFDALAALLEAKQSSLESDIRREDDLGRVLSAFEVTDPALTPLLDAWVVRDERAWPARLARAQHRVAIAWERRGTKWAKETSEEQFTGMRAVLTGVIDDARAALDANPKLTEAYRTLVVAARGHGDLEACLRLSERGLAVGPTSLRLRIALAQCLLPRWGGSYDAVAAMARESQRYVGQNPQLKALLGLVDWDRGRVEASEKRWERAEQLFTRALEAGEHWQFYYDRARSYHRQKRYAETLADLARALALAPEESSTLVLRAKVLVEMKRYDDALADVRVVGELDPTASDLVRFRHDEAETAVHQAYQLLEMTKDIDAAIARCTWAIQLAPDSAEAFYWRGRAYLQRDDRPHALHDFEDAVRLDPRHIEAFRNIDWLLAQRGDWNEIIRYWTRYIDLEPLSGQAYLERGGAYHRKGDREAGLADARRACGLGVQQGCEIVQHAGK